jgi:hypothetical protein
MTFGKKMGEAIGKYTLDERKEIQIYVYSSKEFNI